MAKNTRFYATNNIIPIMDVYILFFIFLKSAQLILKLKYGNAVEAICVSPMLTGIFNQEFPADIKSNLDFKLENWCRADPSSAVQLGRAVFSQLNYTNVKSTISITLLSFFLFYNNTFILKRYSLQFVNKFQTSCSIDF